MVRIAPIRLDFNPRVLWFDAVDIELNVDDRVVVSTARGLELGRVAQAVFDAEDDDLKDIKSPLKPVKRVATEEDAERGDELAAKAIEALPVFRRLASETVPNMNPVAVEYLFEGDKAVFYFESEERVDFRELVRRLASEFHIRVDMKQVGIRDGARMIGGLGHCGQELCCRRLGGEFNPVSIRMAKEQDLSLNPQKISGVCGRLMCCLRYEYDAYKDFHTRAPKKNAKIMTPDGEGKVVALDVPREIISVQVGDDKPVKVPLKDMDSPEEGMRPNSVGKEAWESATAPIAMSSLDVSSLFSSELTQEDKLAKRGSLREVNGGEESQAKRKRKRRRRTTTVSTESEGKSENSKEQQAKTQTSRQGQRSRKASQSQKANVQGQKAGKRAKSANTENQGRSTQVGRNSSALRSRSAPAQTTRTGTARGDNAQVQHRRRRRTHKAGGADEQSSSSNAN